MNPHYELVALRAGHRCEYCHAPEAVFNFPFEVEHIIPLVHGGADAAHNWALACRACNVRKGAYVDHVDPVTHAVVHLYHPRQDPWHDHFRVDTDTGIIEGRTAVGRATVARLEMNSPAQCAARQHWIRLGVFP
jgi:HNH endonuclease